MRAVVLRGYGEVAAAFGLDGHAMLRKLGIDPRVLTDGESRIPANKVLDLLERSADATGCESFALRMAANRNRPFSGRSAC